MRNAFKIMMGKTEEGGRKEIQDLGVSVILN
jgi:hypothetical protein